MKEEKLKIHSCLKVDPKQDIVSLAKLFKSKKERRAFVVDKNKKLLGIVTNSDLVYKAVANKKINLTVEDVMEKKVGSIDLGDPLEKALGIMNKHETFVCPVVNKGVLLGIVNYHDIIDHLLSQGKEE